MENEYYFVNSTGSISDLCDTTSLIRFEVTDLTLGTVEGSNFIGLREKTGTDIDVVGFRHLRNCICRNFEYRRLQSGRGSCGRCAVDSPGNNQPGRERAGYDVSRKVKKLHSLCRGNDPVYRTLRLHNQ